MSKNRDVGPVLVTGGAGYVGREVVALLLAETDGHIIVVDNFSKGRIENIGTLPGAEGRLTILHADIRDEEVINNILTRYKPRAVLHLAAIVDAFATNRKGKDEECMEVNYRAALSLAKQAKASGVKIFIYQSTVSLYSRGEEIREDGEQKPLSTYGISKALAEKEILALNDTSFLTAALRPATVVGFNTGFRYETIFNQACIKAVYGIPLVFFESALEGKKTYLSVHDNAQALLFSIRHIEQIKGKAFNVTSFHASLKELSLLIKKYHGAFTYEVIKEGHINQQVYTINSDALKALGFIPKGTAEMVVRDTVASLKKEKEFLTYL